VTLLRVRPARALRSRALEQRLPTPDIVVAGSELGGAVMAADPAPRGPRILVLERGPWGRPARAGQPRTDRHNIPRRARGVRELVPGVVRARRDDAATSG
jgi:choline dehydrogenase-like flavoprotein